jgi:hypothetical protein
MEKECSSIAAADRIPPEILSRFFRDLLERNLLEYFMVEGGRTGSKSLATSFGLQVLVFCYR